MEENMGTEQRIEIINQKLQPTGETITSWSKKQGLDYRLVFDLIDGKLRGTRGISLNTRMKIEEFFGNIFDK
jgi:gp16 family phage-associated protein